MRSCPPLGTSPRWRPATVGSSCLGGGTGSRLTATVEAYDPNQDVWTTQPSLPVPRASGAAAVVNGVVYLLGGFDGSGNLLTEVDTFLCGPITVSIDIKPGSFPNSINPRSRGKIPVAILSTAGFDAPAQVDQGSLTFGRTGNEQSLAFCNSSPEDVNNDGLLDLICHFLTQLTGFQPSDTQGVLKGQTVSATPILGTDSVRIVK